MTQANEVAADDDDREEQWRFGIDDVGPDGIVEETSPGEAPIEPETVQFEHALFVTVGVVLSIGLLLTAI